jgi:hypothetical protein
MGEYDVRQTAMGGSDETLVKEVSGPLFGAKGWMKFLGVLMIIYAILMTVMTLGIGLIIAWLPFWIGLLLFKAAGSVELAATSGSKQALIETMTRLKTYFTIYGILALIGIVVAVIAMIVFGTTALLSSLSSFSNL